MRAGHKQGTALTSLFLSLVASAQLWDHEKNRMENKVKKVCIELIRKLFTGVKHLVTHVKRNKTAREDDHGGELKKADGNALTHTTWFPHTHTHTPLYVTAKPGGCIL